MGGKAYEALGESDSAESLCYCAFRLTTRDCGTKAEDGARAKGLPRVVGHLGKIG